MKTIQETLKNTLISEKQFRKVSDLTEHDIPTCPGLYAIRINNIHTFPKNFAEELEKRKSNLIYIGEASNDLRKRLWKQELHAKGHGTFFRSIGAVLGYLPLKGSLKINTNNYTFDSEDEKSIIQWITDNLSIQFVEYDSTSIGVSLKDAEDDLIQEYTPIINIQNNPIPFHPLQTLRKRCQDRAHGFTD